MITHLLLDADHVLINKPELWSAKYCREYGVPYESVLPFFTGDFQACLVGKADLKRLLPPWLDRWEWDEGVDAFLRYWFQAEHFIDSELLEEIERLRAAGMKMYVATNQERYRTEYMLEAMGFARQFDGMLASYDLGAVKPDPTFFAAAYDRLCREHLRSGSAAGDHSSEVKETEAVFKDHILFFDDDPENVAGARAFGIRAERYQNIDQFKRVMAQERQ